MNNKHPIEDETIVEDYNGPVYLDGYGNNGYCRDLEELVDELECDHAESEWPDFAYCCTVIPFNVTTSAEEIGEQCCEDMYEDAYDNLKGLEDLQKALDAFQLANKHMESWDMDYSRKIRLPKNHVRK